MRLAAALIAAATLCVGASQSFAQQGAETWDPWEKWSISGGAFIADLDNSARIGGPGVGIEIDLEDALGMKSSQMVFRIDGAYRFGADNRHRVDFTWFDLSREATRTLLQDIEIDGIIYPIGTTVNSDFDLAFYNLRYAYSFIKDDRIDFAGSVGLHITEVGLFLNDTEGLIDSGGDGITAPLPMLGARLDVALTPNWYVRSSIEALYLTYDGYTGSIVDILVAAEYRGWENFALGVGLNMLHFELENDNSLDLGFNGRVQTDFVGLMLYGKAMF